MADGVGLGVGEGIGQGLNRIGDLLIASADRRRQDRDLQADKYEKQAQDISANLAQALQGRPLGQALTTPGPNQDQVRDLYNQLNRTVQMHNGLYGAHETPQLIQRIQRFVGRQPGRPMMDVRATMTPESMVAAAHPTEKSQTLSQQFDEFVGVLTRLHPDWTKEQIAKRAEELAFPAKTTRYREEKYIDSQGVLHPVNVADPQEVQDAEDQGWKLVGGGAGAKGLAYTRDRGTLVSITDKATGKLYNDVNINEPDTPSFIRESFLEDRKRTAQVTADALTERKRREAVQEDRQVRTFWFNQYNRDREKAATAMEQTNTKLKEAAVLRNLATQAQQLKNPTFDRQLLEAIQKSHTQQAIDVELNAGGWVQNTVDAIQRLISGQVMPDNVRDGLAKWLDANFNEWNDEYQREAKAIADIPLPQGVQGGTPNDDLQNRLNDALTPGK
jgi:hypothetical protein